MEATIAQASDLGVMGAGNIKATFEGGETRDPMAAQAAADAARTEAEFIGPRAPKPGVHETARRMHVDLFDHYDDLQRQKSTLAGWRPKHRQPRLPLRPSN